VSYCCKILLFYNYINYCVLPHCIECFYLQKSQGDGGNYLNIGLKDAVVYIALQMGSGEKLEYLGRGRQFDDNLWHTLFVHRNVKMVSQHCFCNFLICSKLMQELVYDAP